MHNTLFFQIDPSLFHLFAISFCTKMVCLCKIIRNNRDGLNITSMNILSFPLSKDVIPCNGILSFLSLHVQLYDRPKSGHYGEEAAACINCIDGWQRVITLQRDSPLYKLFGAGWVQKGVGGIFLKIRPHSRV